jgi:hypothetical protein
MSRGQPSPCAGGCRCPLARKGADDSSERRRRGLAALERLLTTDRPSVAYGSSSVRVTRWQGAQGLEHVELPYTPAVLAILSAHHVAPPVERHEEWTKRRIVRRE